MFRPPSRHLTAPPHPHTKQISVSYFELYKEKVWDLVEQKDKDLPIRETTGKEIVIPDLAAIDVETPEEFERVFADALAKRKVAVSCAYQHIRRSLFLSTQVCHPWISQQCHVCLQAAAALVLVHLHIHTYSRTDTRIHTHTNTYKHTRPLVHLCPPHTISPPSSMESRAEAMLFSSSS